MAKKVALDVLDMTPDQKAAEQAPPPAAPPEEAAAAGPQRPGRRFARLWPAWRPRSRLWLLAPGIVILGAASLAVLSLLSGARPGKEAGPEPTAVAVPADVAPAAEPLILLPGFVVDLTDEGGAARVLFCDAALVVEKMPAAQGAPNWTEARNRIYLTLKGQKIADLLSAVGRRQLKVTLSDELKGLAGIPPLRAIYFTAFQIM
jgi:flagellar basal body-associated protein FliL